MFPFDLVSQKFQHQQCARTHKGALAWGANWDRSANWKHHLRFFHEARHQLRKWKREESPSPYMQAMPFPASYLQRALGI